MAPSKLKPTGLTVQMTRHVAICTVKISWSDKPVPQRKELNIIKEVISHTPPQVMAIPNGLQFISLLIVLNKLQLLTLQGHEEWLSIGFLGFLLLCYTTTVPAHVYQIINVTHKWIINNPQRKRRTLYPIFQICNNKVSKNYKSTLSSKLLFSALGC